MDLEVTERVCRAGHILGIHLIDHVIIGDLRYTSLREHGYIQFSGLQDTEAPA